MFVCCGVRWEVLSVGQVTVEQQQEGKSGFGRDRQKREKGEMRNHICKKSIFFVVNLYYPLLYIFFKKYFHVCNSNFANNRNRAIHGSFTGQL